MKKETYQLYINRDKKLRKDAQRDHKDSLSFLSSMRYNFSQLDKSENTEY